MASKKEDAEIPGILEPLSTELVTYVSRNRASGTIRCFVKDDGLNVSEHKNEKKIDNCEISYIFSDCVENSFLRFLEIMFVENNGVINLQEMKNIIRPLSIVNFFSKHSIPKEAKCYTSKEGIKLRNEWITLVSNIPNIQYKRDNICEIRAQSENVIQMFYYLLGIEQKSPEVNDFKDTLVANLQKINLAFEPIIKSLNNNVLNRLGKRIKIGKIRHQCAINNSVYKSDYIIHFNINCLTLKWSISQEFSTSTHERLDGHSELFL